MTTSTNKTTMPKSVATKTDFPVWKTIKLGIGPKDSVALCEAVKQSGCCVSDWAIDRRVNKPTFYASKREMDVDLVIVSAEDLGFKNGVIPRVEIFARAQ